MQPTGARWINASRQVGDLAEDGWTSYWAEMTGEQSAAYLEDPKARLLAEGLIAEDFHVETKLHASSAGPRRRTAVVCQMLLVVPEERLATLWA